MKNKIKEGFWANEIPMTEKEKKEVELLHKAGCKCELPLLGHIPGEGVRCRMCGVEVKQPIILILEPNGREMRDKKQEVLDNAEGADYPNEERVEGLQTQVNILEDAVDNMDNIISELEEYK